MQPGSVVRFRERFWVVMPAEETQIALRPLIGSPDDVIILDRWLVDQLGYSLPEERPHPAQFPLPEPTHLGDAISARLLWQAARLLLRDGAAPLRALGRISIRPRVYQFVPLLMALRQDPVRLLIADDVGVGKTIEALLIARELWDRGAISRLAVLCPPALCDQWQAELSQKFNLDAVVIRPATLSQLERRTLPGETVYDAFPVQVISIDWAKSERHRALFLQKCPELVIVDEAHAAAPADERSQQQRYELVNAIAEDPNRHLILLTATPHSGKPETFRALLGLLRDEFAAWDLNNLNEPQRQQLARHFVQRTRADLARQEHAAATLPLFPKREARDVAYELTKPYQRLFEAAFAFYQQQVHEEHNTRQNVRQRARYWSALALLRCVMSSPAAALATLRQRAALRSDDLEEDALDESVWREAVLESTETDTDDQAPTAALDAATPTLSRSEQERLAHLRQLAEDVQSTPDADAKLLAALNLARTLLAEGHAPIFWCRYVATAEYLAEALKREIHAAHITCVTGQQPEDKRRLDIAAIPATGWRVLVATDCLSEGINLHEKFDAVVHYDLPWNPNRLEQREGRVDRFGQTKPTVVAVLMYGRDNPVDGAVLDVLLRKAREIHRTLGVFVPVPTSPESVLEALMKALLLRTRRPQQLSLGLETETLHRLWDEATHRERESRSRFAQHALKPELVQRELEATDAVLGDPAAVRAFVLDAAQRLRFTMRETRAGCYDVHFDLHTVPDALRDALSERAPWRITFESPAPCEAEYVGRNHPFVSALARYIFEEAFARPETALAKRAGAIATRAVAQPTALFVLRVRYLLHLLHRRAHRNANETPLLAEAVEVIGFNLDEERGLDAAEALRLLETAQPAANLDLAAKQAWVQRALAAYQAPSCQSVLHAHVQQRAAQLTEAHQRLRAAMREGAHVRVKPPAPEEIDVISAIVLVPPSTP